MLGVLVHERPASACPVGQRSDGDKYGTQGETIAEATACEQRCIGQFVDGKPRGGDHKEAARRAPDLRAAVRERQPVVTGERHPDGRQPAERIGDQRAQAAKLDEKNDHAEVHGRRRRADGDEPAEAPVCRPQAGGLSLSPAARPA